VSQVLIHAVRTEMKEIKGLEERLYGLEQLMVETKKIVQEQSDMTQVHLIFDSIVIIEFTSYFVLPGLV
jgi:RB1-inducible coiled-coil protein 1